MLTNMKSKFPIYKNNPDLVYLDTSATSLKPQVVLDKMNEYYSEYGVNIHRGIYDLSYKASQEYENVRNKVASFLNASSDEIIFTSSATDSLNKLALMYTNTYSLKNSIVLTTELEHHSSILPWLNQKEDKKFKVEYIPLNSEGRITFENFKKVMNEKVKVVAITYLSNVMGYITPLKEIIEEAHKYGAVVIVDAVQAVPHINVDVKDLDCDFLVFSGHKLMGPTGVGVLYGKKNHLEKLKPIFYGGDMVQNVSKELIEIKDTPYCFEAGTPMIAEVIGLGRAIDFILEIGYDKIRNHLDSLKKYLIEKFQKIAGVSIHNKNADVPIFSFNLNGVHPHDAATCYDDLGICLRAGHHCAQLVTTWLDCIATLRVSLYIYNDYEDIDKFIDATKKTIDLFARLDEKYE